MRRDPADPAVLEAVDLRLASPGLEAGSPPPLRRIRLHGDGGSRLVGRLRDRSGAARAGWRLESLFATMALVVAIIAVVSATYHQLIGRFPPAAGAQGDRRGIRGGVGVRPARRPARRLHLDGGGELCGGGRGGDRVSAGVASRALPLALGLTAGGRPGVLVGHRGRVGFAIATQGFLLLALMVVSKGAFAEPVVGSPPLSDREGLCSATRRSSRSCSRCPWGWRSRRGGGALGRDRPAPQLGDRVVGASGGSTLWLMVAIVGSLTMASRSDGEARHRAPG